MFECIFRHLSHHRNVHWCTMPVTMPPMRNASISMSFITLQYISKMFQVFTLRPLPYINFTTFTGDICCDLSCHTRWFAQHFVRPHVGQDHGHTSDNPKWGVVPNKPWVFLLKMIIWRCFVGYHHLRQRKHPNEVGKAQQFDKVQRICPTTIRILHTFFLATAPVLFLRFLPCTIIRDRQRELYRNPQDLFGDLTNL